MSNGNIFIHLSGSISCYKACALISHLVQDGYAVQTSASPSALRFIGRATLEGLTRRPTLTSMFDGQSDYIPHIKLAQGWAQLIIAYPASANLINRLAAGLCDDLFGAVFLANNFRNPVWIAPAMNSQMIAHPAVVQSLKTLEDWGVHLVYGESGHMACGSVGEGRLAEPDVVFRKIQDLLCVY